MLEVCFDSSVSPKEFYVKHIPVSEEGVSLCVTVGRVSQVTPISGFIFCV